jgi:hypothetical protein
MDELMLLLLALKGAALSCLHALRLAARPVTSGWLCLATGYSDKTVTRALLKLQEMRLASFSKTDSGWVLEGTAELEQFFQPLCRKNSDHETLESESSLFKSLEIKKKDSRVSLQAEIFQCLELETLLPAIQELFGEPLLLRRGQAPEPLLLLALVAEAHHNRAKLGFPARAVCGGLNKGRQPAADYFERPWDFLPNWFLERIGLGDQAGQTEPDMPEAAVPTEPEYPVDRASLDQPVIQGRRLSAGKAWDEACSQLRRTLPPAIYSRFLGEAIALAYDPEEGVLVVTASDPEARLWLDGRLRLSLERELSNVAGCDLRLDIREPPEN